MKNVFQELKRIADFTGCGSWNLLSLTHECQNWPIRLLIKAQCQTNVMVERPEKNNNYRNGKSKAVWTTGHNV